MGQISRREKMKRDIVDATYRHFMLIASPLSVSESGDGRGYKGIQGYTRGYKGKGRRTGQYDYHTCLRLICPFFSFRIHTHIYIEYS